MRVAVTGASGFIGGTIARELVSRGHTVYAFGRRSPSLLSAPLPSYERWDVLDGVIRSPEVEAVVHCAACVGQWGPENAYRAINVDGTRAVLESFRSAPRFVYISTSSVYAHDQPKVRLREDAPVGEPSLTAYARTKAEAERLVRESHCSAVILRPHIVYGPGDTTLLPRVLAARRLGWLPVPGDGRNRVAVTHVLNLVHAVECALDASDTVGAFNVADDEMPAMGELLRTLLRRLGISDRLFYIPRAVAWRLAIASERVAGVFRATREPLLTRYVVANMADECTLDLSRVRQALSYEARWSFRDAPLA